MMKQSGLDEALITCFLFLCGMCFSAASVFWNMNIWFIECFHNLENDEKTHFNKS